MPPPSKSCRWKARDYVESRRGSGGRARRADLDRSGPRRDDLADGSLPGEVAQLAVTDFLRQISATEIREVGNPGATIASFRKIGGERVPREGIEALRRWQVQMRVGTGEVALRVGIGTCAISSWSSPFSVEGDGFRRTRSGVEARLSVVVAGQDDRIARGLATSLRPRISGSRSCRRTRRALRSGCARARADVALVGNDLDRGSGSLAMGVWRQADGEA